MKIFLLYIISLSFIFSQKILIPMDNTQNDHLKAYGLAFWILKQNDNRHLFISGFVINPNFNVGKYYYIKEFKTLFKNIINGVWLWIKK